MGKKKINTYTNFVVSGKILLPQTKESNHEQAFKNLISKEVKLGNGSNKTFDTRGTYKIEKIIEPVKNKDGL